MDNSVCTTRGEETPIGVWGEGVAVGTKTFQLLIGKGAKEGKITIEVCDREKANARVGDASKRDDDMRAGLSARELLATATSVGVRFVSGVSVSLHGLLADSGRVSCSKFQFAM